MEEQLEINIAHIIAQKSGKQLPKWVARLVQRLIHEDEINEMLRRHGNKKGADFLCALLDDFGTTVRFRNPESLPQDGRAIFVSNHPLGAIDGIGITYLLHKHYGKVQYLVNDMLYYLKPLQPVFLPVNTYGKQKKENLKRIQEILAGDSPVGTFPAGWCSRYRDGKVQDNEWKHSFVNMAISHQRDIIPLYFVGHNSPHFYIIDRLRKALGIKFDICTALLPDEMFRAKGKDFEVVVGEAIRWQDLAADPRRIQEQAAHIRSLSYQLAREVEVQ